MDQTTGQIIAAVLGGGGVTGALTQFVSLRRLKHREDRWRADMEKRLSKLEDQSPEALVKRIDQVEELREQAKRDTDATINRLRNGMREALEELARIQQRLNIPAV